MPESRISEALAADAAKKAMAAATRERCGDAEVFVCLTSTKTLSVEYNKVLSASAVRDSQVFVRVVDDRRMGVAFTNSLSATSLRGCVSAARRLARISDSDPKWNGFPEGVERGPSVKGLKDEVVESITMADLKDSARAMVDSALEEAVGITVTSGQLETVTRAIAVDNTSGVESSFSDAHTSVTCGTVSGHGSTVSPDCYFERFSRRADIDPSEVGSRCASVARDCAVSAEGTTEESQVVFAPAAIGVPFNGLLNIIMTKACSGESAVQRTTFLADLIGERVGPKSLTITDDPLAHGLVGARPFDDEGVPSKRTPLIADGVFKGFVWSSHHGAMAGRRSTGNAVRDLSTGYVTSAPLNMSFKPGKGSLKDLISEVDHGYLVWGCQGAHTSNVETGDFSFVPSPCFLIEGGVIVGCVKAAMMSGNILDIFSGIERIGGDLMDLKSTVCPSLLVGGMKITTA